MRTCLIIPLLLLALSASATTITVDLGGSGDYLTIQEGIDAAVYGDTVLVACGTYYEHDIVMKSGVCLRSETGQPECVTVDADSLGRAFYCTGADSTTIVEGLTITRGLDLVTLGPCGGGGMRWEDSSPRIVRCSFAGNVAHNLGGTAYGGAIDFTGCSPVITDCIFTNNTAKTSWPHGNTYGGGIRLGDSDATISACVFSSNWAADGGGLYASGGRLLVIDCVFEDNSAAYGGGMEVYATGIELTLMGCQFLGNDAHQGGGAILGRNATIAGCTFAGNTAELIGGMQCWSGNTVTDCVFSGNVGDYTGGVDCTGASVFERCTFVGNHSGWWAGGINLYAGGTLRECVVMDNVAERGGGGVRCGNPHEGSTEITDCVIAGNYAWEAGGGIACVETLGISITGCTISGNRANEGGGAIASLGGARPIVENSILSFSLSGGSVLCDSTSSVSLACSDVFGNEEGNWIGCIADQESLNGNFSLDPLFCDMYGDDFTLCANSPCLPVSRDCTELIGALGQGCDNCNSPIEGALFVTSCSEEAVTLQWTLGGLGGYSGLNLYRATEESGDFIKLNRELLPSSSPGSFVDMTVWPATVFRYQLTAVHANGAEENAGESASVTTPGQLTAVAP